MEASNSESDNRGLIALRTATVAVTLVLFFTPLRPLAILLIALVALVCLLKFAYVANRVIGISLILIVGFASASYLFLHYCVDRDYQRLLTELTAYDDVTIRRELFPLPRISQLSVGYGVSAAEFSEILKLNGLAGISELYLDSNKLTDASLATVASKFDLNYVFIDCANITDAAILDFEKRFPNCTVIPYNRDLHDAGIDVHLGQPPIGD